MIIVEIAGHLGSDPEVRFTPSGQKVVTLRVATNIKKGGQEKTVWWNVTIWGDRFDKLLPYLKKGSAVIVIGEMGEPRLWVDKMGNSQIGLDLTAEIIRFSPFGRTGQEQTQGQGMSQGMPQGAPQGAPGYAPAGTHAMAANGSNYPAGAVGVGSSPHDFTDDDNEMPF